MYWQYLSYRNAPVKRNVSYKCQDTTSTSIKTRNRSERNHTKNRKFGQSISVSYHAGALEVSRPRSTHTLDFDTKLSHQIYILLTVREKLVLINLYELSGIGPPVVICTLSQCLSKKSYEIFRAHQKVRRQDISDVPAVILTLTVVFFNNICTQRQDFEVQHFRKRTR
jgi:hypothetical protein